VELIAIQLESGADYVRCSFAIFRHFLHLYEFTEFTDWTSL